MLKQLPAVAQQTEYATVKAELLPRMHSMCLKTTSASVRANSLTCMARLAAGLHEDEAVKMLQTAGKVGHVCQSFGDTCLACNVCLTACQNKPDFETSVEIPVEARSSKQTDCTYSSAALKP